MIVPYYASNNKCIRSWFFTLWNHFFRDTCNFHPSSVRCAVSRCGKGAQYTTVNKYTKAVSRRLLKLDCFFSVLFHHKHSHHLQRRFRHGIQPPLPSVYTAWKSANILPLQRQWTSIESPSISLLSGVNELVAEDIVMVEFRWTVLHILSSVIVSEINVFMRRLRFWGRSWENLRRCLVS